MRDELAAETINIWFKIRRNHPMNQQRRIFYYGCATGHDITLCVSASLREIKSYPYSATPNILLKCDRRRLLRKFSKSLLKIKTPSL
jgi:hypothetical protein